MAAQVSLDQEPAADVRSGLLVTMAVPAQQEVSLDPEPVVDLRAGLSVPAQQDVPEPAMDLAGQETAAERVLDAAACRALGVKLC